MDFLEFDMTPMKPQQIKNKLEALLCMAPPQNTKQVRIQNDQEIICSNRVNTKRIQATNFWWYQQHLDGPQEFKFL